MVSVFSIRVLVGYVTQNYVWKMKWCWLYMECNGSERSSSSGNASNGFRCFLIRLSLHLIFQYDSDMTNWPFSICQILSKNCIRIDSLLLVNERLIAVFIVINKSIAKLDPDSEHSHAHSQYTHDTLQTRTKKNRCNCTLSSVIHSSNAMLYATNKQ